MERLQQKQVDVNYFYTLLNQFMDELVETFPEEKIRIERYRMLINTTRKANYMTPIKTFYDAVVPYKEKVFDCDDAYFLNEKNMKEITEGDEETLVEGLELKKLWTHPETTTDVRAAIWCYLQELLTVSEKLS